MAIRCQPDLQASPTTVFITGATGFIGQRLVSTLLEQGVRVRALVRPGNKSDSRIPKACEQVPVGLTDVDKLADIVTTCSAVIYCAGSVRGRNAADFSVANINGVKAMREALERSNPTAPLLLLSSLAASKPELSDYAYSKYAGEQLLQGTALNWTILRPPAVYGPGDREMLPLLKMIRRGVLVHAGPAGQRLSLLHVDDLVNAVITWLSAPHECQHATYAIDDGTPGGYNWMAIGEAVSEKKFNMLKVPHMLLSSTARLNLVFSRLLGYVPMLSPGKVRELVQPEWLGDNTAFTEATGWRPQLDLKQGVRQLFNDESDV
ncbi:MAG: NAD(P)-dependent oxidoreductase [Lysobacterales bacterium]